MRTNVSDKIANIILKTQRGFAGLFGSMTAGFGKRGKMIFLIGICIAFGGLSASSIVNVFIPGNNVVLKPDTVSVPRHFNKMGEPVSEDVNVVSAALYKRLQDFKIYMDSLRQHSKAKYDSIVRIRPGLMDSVLFLEQIYLQQNR